MSTTPTAGERLRYWFDNWMSKGTVALMALLGVATLVFIVVLGTVSWLWLKFVTDSRNNLEDDSTGPLDLIWRSLMRTLDPGTMGGDTGWEYRILMLIVTVGGLVIVASLIGIVSAAFDGRVEELRKGRSRVLERDHTVILGWSSKVYPVIRELSLANRSRGRSSIVVLADRDKVAMEDDIKAHVPDTGSTRIIVRSGDPMNLAELEIANPHQARSIILFAPDDAGDPDALVIKTALAVTNSPHRREAAYHAVAELRDPSNLEAARLVGRDEVHWVLSTELVSQIIVQTCRQSGLSVIYSELLGFDGNEIYVWAHPSLVGRSYFDAQLAFVDSVVIGLLRAGVVTLNPAADTVIDAADQLILIAEGDDTIRVSAPGVPDPTRVSVSTVEPRGPETTLVLGYNAGLHVVLSELEQYAAVGSRVCVVADVDDPGLASTPRLEVEFRRGDPTHRATLDSLGVSAYDRVVVLAAKETLAAQQADAKTLITLLHLRDIAEREGVRLSVVSEMVDDRNRELAEVTRADDFIVSDQLISRMLSQVSENRVLADVFDDLFSAVGAEIYLRPAADYVPVGVGVDFYTVLEAARQRGETAIGYRIGAESRSGAHSYGVRLNPRKDISREFGPDDRVIVVAEG